MSLSPSDYNSMVETWNAKVPTQYRASKIDGDSSYGTFVGALSGFIELYNQTMRDWCYYGRTIDGIRPGCNPSHIQDALNNASAAANQAPNLLNDDGKAGSVSVSINGVANKCSGSDSPADGDNISWSDKGTMSIAGGCGGWTGGVNVPFWTGVSLSLDLNPQSPTYGRLTVNASGTTSHSGCYCCISSSHSAGAYVDLGSDFARDFDGITGRIPTHTFSIELPTTNGQYGCCCCASTFSLKRSTWVIAIS